MMIASHKTTPRHRHTALLHHHTATLFRYVSQCSLPRPLASLALLCPPPALGALVDLLSVEKGNKNSKGEKGEEKGEEEEMEQPSRKKSKKVRKATLMRCVSLYNITRKPGSAPTPMRSVSPYNITREPSNAPPPLLCFSILSPDLLLAILLLP
jgi:hypothetical protein